MANTTIHAQDSPAPGNIPQRKPHPRPVPPPTCRPNISCWTPMSCCTTPSRCTCFDDKPRRHPVHRPQRAGQVQEEQRRHRPLCPRSDPPARCAACQGHALEGCRMERPRRDGARRVHRPVDLRETPGLVCPGHPRQPDHRRRLGPGPAGAAIGDDYQGHQCPPQVRRAGAADRGLRGREGRHRPPVRRLPHTRGAQRGDRPAVRRKADRAGHDPAASDRGARRRLDTGL